MIFLLYVGNKLNPLHRPSDCGSVRLSVGQRNQPGANIMDAKKIFMVTKGSGPYNPRIWMNEAVPSGVQMFLNKQSIWGGCDCRERHSISWELPSNKVEGTIAVLKTMGFQCFQEGVSSTEELIQCEETIQNTPPGLIL